MIFFIVVALLGIVIGASGQAIWYSCTQYSFKKTRVKKEIRDMYKNNLGALGLVWIPLPPTSKLKSIKGGKGGHDAS